jgi:hypothetical protein
VNDVFAFVGPLARKVDGVLEEAEGAVLVGPVVIAMTVIAGEDSRRRGADLSGRLEPALDDAALRCRASSLMRTRSIALARCAVSKSARSSEWTTNTRTPAWFAATSCTKVFDAFVRSRVVMPALHSIHGPGALDDSRTLRRCAPSIAADDVAVAAAARAAKVRLNRGTGPEPSGTDVRSARLLLRRS